MTVTYLQHSFACSHVNSKHFLGHNVIYRWFNINFNLTLRNKTGTGINPQCINQLKKKDKGTNMANDSVYTIYSEKPNGGRAQANRQGGWAHEREMPTHGAKGLLGIGNILSLHCGNGGIVVETLKVLALYTSNCSVV